MTISTAIYLATVTLVLGANQAPSNDTNINQALVRSCELEKNKDYPKAVAVLMEQRDAHSDNYLLNLRLGWLEHLNGKYADSVQYYQAAMAIHPKSIEAKLGCLLPMLTAPQYKEAETLARQIIKDDPGNYYANLRLVVALRLQQKYAEAMGIVKGMLVAYPADVYYIKELALLNDAQGTKDADPNPSPDDKSQTSEALSKSYQYEGEKNYPEAIKVLLEQHTAHPQDYLLNLRLGWLYYLSGNNGNSSRYYYTAIQAMPRSTEAGVGYLLPLLAQARYKDAESFARQILEGDPGNYYGNLRLAVALRLQGKYAEAEKVVQPMLDAYPADIYFMNEMGLLKIALGKKDVSKQLFADVLSLDPENATAKQQFSGL